MDSKASSKANLKKYINVNGKWRFVPVARHDGKPTPKTVLIDGIPTHSRAGTFYLEWRQDGKRIQQPVGTSPQGALEAWRVQCGVLADPDGVPEIEANERNTVIPTAVDVFLRQVKATKSEATHDGYDVDLQWFKSKIGKHYVSAVTRDDIIRLMAMGREEGLNQKTINKRLIVTLMALRNAGATIEMKKGDWPKTTDNDVEIYEEDELKAFFGACDVDEKLLFQVYLFTGFRNREVATLTWDSVDFKRNQLSVKPRADFRFVPKSYEERGVRVPAALIALLKQHQKHSKGKLVFPTRPHPKRPNYGGDSPDAHHLELCKKIAHRAELNCGTCKSTKGKCKTTANCEQWYLHKFRHTFATNMLRSGMDIKSLQTLLGHKSLATTEKYLKALNLDKLEHQVETSTLRSFLA
jgi:integrase/recombinase XerD